MLKRFLKKKSKGDASIAALSAFMLILLSIALMFTIFYRVIINRVQNVQDDVTLSNLAVYKNIDLTALADDDKWLRINDPNAAFETFKEHLKTNMKLDAKLNGLSGSAADGQVTIDEFTIYNVRGNNVDIWTYGPDTHMFTESSADRSLTVLKTSDDSVVKNTSVHATIKFNTDILFGQKKETSVSVDTDIVK